MNKASASPETPGLHVYISNRLEPLSRALASLMDTGKDLARQDNVLAPETIVVQSTGMQRWLSMALADLLGVCANIRFLFPNELLDLLVFDLKGEYGSTADQPDPWEPDILAFRVLKILGNDLDNPAYQSLKQYLAPGDTPFKRYQLALSIAKVFDQYQVFRPRMLMQWQKGKRVVQKHARWQARIWRSLVNNCNTANRSIRHEELISLLADNSLKGDLLPHRVTMFGITHLPPFHLSVFESLSSKIPVYLFLVNPCRVFWADILGPFEQVRIKRQHAEHWTNGSMLHLYTGNRLLALWGGMGRSFFEQITGLESLEKEFFEDPGNDSVLNCVQKDILDLSEEQTRNQTEKDLSSIENDQSIQVHVCHSPMRELEILHDNLAHLLETYPDLNCNDILVMTPELEKYVPLIHAVFGKQTTGRPRLPYTVADKTDLSTDSTIRTFMKILELPSCRMQASLVLDLLESESICARFGIDGELKADFGKWISEAGIRWGIDATDRQKYIPGADEHNTWTMGLDRLILGSVMQPKTKLVGGLLPAGQVHGRQAVGLGRLIALFEAVVEIRRKLQGNRSGLQWPVLLNEITDRIFEEKGQWSTALAELKRIIGYFGQCLELAQCDSDLSVDIIKNFIKNQIENKGTGAGFLSGGITFCAMLPMRSIPAKVICLLGMGQGCFPRSDHRVGFDLTNSYPRPWDRSRRSDDMYLFLESLLSARRIFYVSYVGRDINDNATIPPSSMVSQLLDYLSERFNKPGRKWVTEHKLHGFDPDYFNGRDSKMFSFSQQDFLACKAASDTKGNNNKLESLIQKQPLPEPSNKWKSLTLEELKDFFIHPCRFVLQNRLGISFPTPKMLVRDSENFSLQGLDRYRISQEIMEGRIHAIDHEHLQALIKAHDVLPHGTMAETIYKNLATEADIFLETLNKVIGGHNPSPILISVSYEGFKITGRLDGIYNKGQIIYRFARLKAKDIVRAFVDHLFFQIDDQVKGPKYTRLIVQNDIWKWKPLVKPEIILKSLLKLYWKGLTSPLPFFPEPSLEYARRVLLMGQDKAFALEAARKKLPGNFFNGQARNTDPYLEFCFGCDPELNRRFEETAMEVFGPIFSFREKAKN